MKASFSFFFLKDLLIFRKRREKERERNINVRENIDQVPLVCALTEDRACNPGMYPEWESNQ